MAGRWLLLVGLAALSACATPPAGPPQPGEAAAPPPSSINGRYRGIARLVKATIAGCPRSFGTRLVVVDANALSLNYRGAKASFALVATVAGDGSIYGTDGTGTIQGRISGNHMDLVVSSDYCGLHYALDRIGGS
jgi:hypothetical protein